MTLRRRIKALPVLGPLARYVSGTLIQTPGGKPHATVFGFCKGLPDRPEYCETKLDPGRSLCADRLREIELFFGRSRLSMLLHFLRNGTPNTSYYRLRLGSFFEQTSAGHLKQCYDEAAFQYSCRLMLRYHRYGLGHRLLGAAADAGWPAERLRLLDYGCGVADAALLAAVRGAHVTIVDLQDEKFDFAVWRFEVRALPHARVAAKQTELPIEVDGSFHVVIMSEFLEHVRDPQRFLDFALSHLVEGGLLYDPLGPRHKHGIGGDHLAETKLAMEDRDYAAYHRAHLKPVPDFEYLYSKR